MATKVFKLVVEWDDVDPSEGIIMTGVELDDNVVKALLPFEFDRELPASEQLRKVVGFNIAPELRRAGVL